MSSFSGRDGHGFIDFVLLLAGSIPSIVLLFDDSNFIKFNISTTNEICEIMKSLNPKVGECFRNLLEPIPNLSFRRATQKRIQPYVKSFELTLVVEHRGIEYLFVVKHLERTYPQDLNLCLFEIHTQLEALSKEVRTPRFEVVPILFSPYFSPQCREICTEQGVNYLDMCGNATLVTETLFISKEVERKPKTETRKLRSIFGTKAGVILRTLLLNPKKVWKVKDLADKSNVSIGHVSNIRSALIENDWLEKLGSGVALKRPDVLLANWRENYKRPLGDDLYGYTYFHGRGKEQMLGQLFNELCDEEYPPLIYARGSASEWYAPWLRDSRDYFYANMEGVALLESRLNMSFVDRGENIVLNVVKDVGLLKDHVNMHGALCTDPITTYLDLWNGNDREQEAAELLAEECFQWQK